MHPSRNMKITYYLKIIFSYPLFVELEACAAATGEGRVRMIVSSRSEPPTRGNGGVPGTRTADGDCPTTGCALLEVRVGGTGTPTAAEASKYYQFKKMRGEYPRTNNLRSIEIPLLRGVYIYIFQRSNIDYPPSNE